MLENPHSEPEAARYFAGKLNSWQEIHSMIEQASGDNQSAKLSPALMRFIGSATDLIKKILSAEYQNFKRSNGLNDDVDEVSIDAAGSRNSNNNSTCT